MGILGIDKYLAKVFAKNFGLQNREDVKIFKKHWKLVKEARKFKDKNKKALEKAINDSFFYLCRQLLVKGECFYKGTGSVARASIDRKYVIFSDHHYLPSNNRHNYFQKYNNYKMYRKLLERYNAKEYTLVENGDVEDLVIFEPTLDEVKDRVKMTWEELEIERFKRRKKQLNRIIDDYNDLYDQIRDSFFRDGRFIKLAGNHDLSLQNPDVRDILRRKYRGIEVKDFLSIERDPSIEMKKAKPSFLVAHGHQFDTVSHPLYAGKLGEVFSECLGWAYQGADRIWEWEDGPRQWVEGEEFNNTLVSAKAKGKGCLFELLQDNHEVAWEYFESKWTVGAIFKEVLTGDEFFKYRHTSEIFIKDKIKEYFPDQSQSPCLILGHTHEPRVQPYDKDAQRGFLNYANSGSAGRFANLIWAIEIERGLVRVVSWHYRNQEACRQVYSIVPGHQNALRASSAFHTPVP